MKLDTLIVNRNGAHIHHPTYNVVKSALINKRVLKEIVESDYFQSIVEMYIEVGKDLYVEKGKMEYFSHNRYEFINIFYNHEIHDCNAIILLVENDLVDEIERFLNRLGDIRVDVWRHQGEYKTTMMEIFSKEVDKVKGIDFLCDYYQIPLERTIAIGDQVNDIEMIKYAGMGVAVSNAIEPLKEVADVVLNKTNNEGAVGLYLSEIFHIDLNMIDIL